MKPRGLAQRAAGKVEAYLLNISVSVLCTYITLSKSAVTCKNRFLVNKHYIRSGNGGVIFTTPPFNNIPIFYIYNRLCGPCLFGINQRNMSVLLR